MQTASERTDSEELSATAETASHSQTEASQQDADEWVNQAPSEAGSQTDSASAASSHAARTGAVHAWHEDFLCVKHDGNFLKLV